MSAERFRTFAEFWPYYLGEHSAPGCRWLHFIGSTLGLAALARFGFTLEWWLIPLGLVIGYGFAWIGHFGIEKNRPATFKYPIWSFLGDWKMWALMLTGRLDAEIQRLKIQPAR